MEFASIDTNGEGYLLEKSRIQWYFDHYFQYGEDRRAASPLASATCVTKAWPMSTGSGPPASPVSSKSSAT